MDWQPFFLRPETPPEGMSLPSHVLERMRDPNHPLKRRADAAGLKMAEGRTWMPSTRRAHEAAEFARDHGKLDALHAILMRRYFGEKQDLYAWDVLRGAAVEAGLDPDEMQRSIEEGRYGDRVQQGVAQARALGVQSVPTFLIADRLAIQGAEEYATFEEAMRRLGVKPRS